MTSTTWASSKTSGHFDDNVVWELTAWADNFENPSCEVKVYKRENYIPGGDGKKYEYRTLKVYASDRHGTDLLASVFRLGDGLTDRELSYYSEKVMTLLKKKKLCRK